MTDSKTESIERGATILEFAFAFMVFIPIILGVIDWGRYMSVQGTLNKAAQHALTVAQTVSGLETAYDTDKTPYDEALTLVKQSGEKFLNSSSLLKPGGMSPVNNSADPIMLEIPANGPGVALESAFLSQPLTVTTSADFNFILPFIPNQTITARAVGFREPRYIISRAIKVDCMGNPEGASGYNAYCNCPAGSIWINWMKACAPCDAGKVAIKGECRCDDTVPCPGNQRRDVYSCQCACNINNGGWNEMGDTWKDKLEDGGACACPAGYYKDTDNMCKCNTPPTCTGGKILTTECTCDCPEEKVWYAAGNKCISRICSETPNCPENNCICDE